MTSMPRLMRSGAFDGRCMTPPVGVGPTTHVSAYPPTRLETRHPGGFLANSARTLGAAGVFVGSGVRGPADPERSLPSPWWRGLDAPATAAGAHRGRNARAREARVLRQA